MYHDVECKYSDSSESRMKKRQQNKNRQSISETLVDLDRGDPFKRGKSGSMKL